MPYVTYAERFGMEKGVEMGRREILLESIPGLLQLRFGAAAIRLVAERQFGMMVAFQPPGIVAIPLEKAIANPRRVPLDSDTITTARDLGISFGD